MTSSIVRAWAPITKIEDLDDGSVMVSGPAADAGLDRDGQRLDQTWLDRAMPEWMAEGANVREQHDHKRAVGVGVGLVRSDTGTHDLAAAIVDPVAIRKVRPGPDGRPPVLKGFSVGIKNPVIDFGRADAPNGVVVDGKIIEVSLVDRPANPRTLFAMVKADGAEDAELEPVDHASVVTSDEVTRQAAEVAAEIKALIPDTSKADAAGDIADIQQAIAIIARVIASEADGLAAGQMGEVCDIDCLLDGVRALKYFIQREASEPAPETSEMVTMADEIKTDAPTPAPVEPAPTEPVLNKTDIPAMIKAAITEATEPLRAELGLVKSELARVKALPVQGGPVASRTGVQAAAARERDALALSRQADDLIAKADSAEDPVLAAGYRARATALREQAVR